MADQKVRSYRFYGRYLQTVPSNVTVWVQPADTTGRLSTCHLYNGNAAAQLQRVSLYSPASGTYVLISTQLASGVWVTEHPDAVLHPGDEIRIRADVANTAAFHLSGFIYSSAPVEPAGALPPGAEVEQPADDSSVLAPDAAAGSMAAPGPWPARGRQQADHGALPSLADG